MWYDLIGDVMWCDIIWLCQPFFILFLTGRYPQLIRPPFGKTNNEINDLIENKTGMKVILWSIDAGKLPDQNKSKKMGEKRRGKDKDRQTNTEVEGLDNSTDSLKKNNSNNVISSEIMVKNVLENVAVGDIIYFKEGNSELLIALPIIIDFLHSKGYELLTVSDMLSFPDDKPHWWGPGRIGTNEYGDDEASNGGSERKSWGEE